MLDEDWLGPIESARKSDVRFALRGRHEPIRGNVSLATVEYGEEAFGIGDHNHLQLNPLLFGE